MIAALLAMVIAQTACTSRDTQWAPLEAVVLRLPDGTAWGSVGGGWSLPVVAQGTFHPEGGATIEARKFGIRIEAHARDLSVFLRAPQNFGNGFTSAAATPLRVTRVFGDGGVELVPVTRTDVEALSAWQPMVAECDRLCLNGERRQQSADATLQHDARLLVRPGGRETFELPKGTKLHIVQTGKSATKVEALLDDGSKIAGWLNEHLPAQSAVRGVVIEIGTACRSAQFPPPRDCTNELHLFATDGTQRGEIGVMDASTLFDVVSSDGDWVTISPREQFFGLMKGWRLVVRGEELEKCSAVPRSVGAHFSRKELGLTDGP